MERRPEMDVPRAVSALPAPVSAAPALCLAAALVLGAGEARAAEVCSNTPVVGDTILCSVAASTPGTIEIDARNLAISTAATNDRGIEGQHRGREGVVDFDLTGGSVAATGDGGVGIHAWRSSNSGAISITTTNLAVTAGGAARSGAVRSIWVQHWGAGGNVDIDLTGGSLEATTRDSSAYGVWGYYSSGPGTVSITAKDRITVTATAGQYAYGLNGRHERSGDVSITTENAAVTATGGTAAYGVLGWHTGASGAVGLDLTGGSVTAAGPSAYGVYGVGTPSGGISITTENLDVTATGGQRAYGVYGYHYGTSGDVDIDLNGGSVTAEGLSGHGLIGRHSGLGSVTITTDAEAKIKAPFSVGVQGILTSGANEAGRVVIDSGGATEAREVGVFGWAARSSGHTFGEGAQTADDASRTEPMIHVTSSGDVTVGSSVTDAFIRSRVAGADGTLSTAEQGVLDAIVEDGGSDALETALEALPAAYDDDYKAQARELLRKRGFETADGASLAYLAAAEILAIPRAGVRAMALSHLAIADHVRNGDLDPAILAIRVPWRTAEDRAALAEQGRLSDAERAVLEAVLTGGDVEAALDPLPADYTDEWRAGVRRHAMSYNAGDLRVEVTGGAVVSGGDGVDARHVLPHDRNGAIAVTVDEGAEVTGGRHGIFVGGAGFAEGNDDLRTQTVTVNGAVMGGTGAGVHLAGGGTVMVGRTGRIGATSGVGILSDGAGDLVATVAGRVEGDVRARGGGNLTLDVREGGAVTGTVHDPAGPLTVAGSIGRLLYTNGGTVTVAATGRLTGVEVEGGTEALRSEAGNLAVTVAGTVAGDLRAPTGGALTVDVQEGGAVTGTVHDPAGPLTVAGSIGRLLYTNGGTVTVAATGRLTGVEGETEALRSEAGDLAVTVAGTVAGDVRARGGGDLTLDVQEGGAVTGTVRDPAGPLTVRGSIGRLLYTNGGTVTVAATGRLTGVEVEGGTEAVRSEAGDLSVTVAAMGRATGDLRAQGGGDLDATISGTVEGDVRAQGGGVLTLAVTEGGEVAGTVHDPAGPLTVVGSIGRLLYSNGGTVTVAATGRLTGVEVEGGTEAVRSEAGDLALTVAGTVAGDVRALAGGALTLDVQEGGAVTGTVHDPAGPLTVAGSIGRLLYGNGGTVTVAGTGRLTGIEAEGGTEAVRSEAGDLAVTVAEMGMVTGDVLGRGGDLNAVVAGTVRGDLVEEGAGGLSATVTGTVEGNVFGRGAGEHTVTVAAGGTVTGTIDLAAEGGTVTVGGTAGRVRFGNGGTVTVAGAGRLTGVEVEGGTEAVRNEAGDLAVAVSEMGTVTGGILGRGGDLNAVVAGTVGGDLVEEGAGGLSATISGTIEGNVFGRGAGEHTVTVADGGTVTGAIDLAAEGGTVTVGGTAGRVRLEGGGLVTVMDGGSIDSREDGIRAFYATPDADNGAISVVVAAGGAVTGARAGIYVANAGLDAGGDGAADGVLKQSVTVHGTVTGGTDAAVHLVGGGTLEVGATGKVGPRRRATRAPGQRPRPFGRHHPWHGRGWQGRGRGGGSDRRRQRHRRSDGQRERERRRGGLRVQAQRGDVPGGHLCRRHHADQARRGRGHRTGEGRYRPRPRRDGHHPARRQRRGGRGQGELCGRRDRRRLHHRPLPASGARRRRRAGDHGQRVVRRASVR